MRTTYWRSEYRAAGQPVEFRCGCLVHLTAATPTSSAVPVFELTPSVRVGGPGLGETQPRSGTIPIDDIRFVEPTVTDREPMLAWIGTLGRR